MMADVLNRVTRRYLKSVNTPDFPEVDWIINPDLSAVSGVAEKYWKIYGDSVVEMSATEKAAVDAAFPAQPLSTRLKYTVKLDGHLSLGLYVRWLPKFIVVYRNQTPISWENMTGVNSLDTTRAHFIDDEPNSAADADMCNAIRCPDFVTGDNIEVDYREQMTLAQRVAIAPTCWDFELACPHSIQFNWPDGPNEMLNSIVPKQLSSVIGPLQLQEMGCTLQQGVRFDKPCFTPAVYTDGQGQPGRVDFLFPNVLIDQSQSLNYSYAANDLRVEAWEFPRRRRNEAEVRVVSSGKFNYVGHWTTNLMRCVNTVFYSTGYRSRSALIGLRFRKLSTNEVSGWLPLRIAIRRKYSPVAGIPQTTNSTMWVKFNY